MNYLYKLQFLPDESWSNRGCSLELSFPTPLNSTVEDFVVGLQFRFDHQVLMNPAHWVLQELQELQELLSPEDHHYFLAEEMEHHR
jgi:hypothetical protein